MRCDAPIRKNKRFVPVTRIPLQSLWWKIDGRSGTGANQLPQRHLQVAVVQRWIVILGIRVIASSHRENPWWRSSSLSAEGTAGC